VPDYLDYIGWEEVTRFHAACRRNNIPGGALLPLLCRHRDDEPAGTWTQRRLQLCVERLYDLVGQGALLVEALPSTIAAVPVRGEGRNERLFIGAIRCQEILFDLAAQALLLAVSASDSSAIVDRLNFVARALHLSRTVMSTLGSIERDDFLGLRAATAGASAIDSPAYLGLLSAGAQVGAMQERWSRDLQAQVSRANDAFISWSSLHRALARHFLGDAAGTGGTQGAEYLEVRSQRALVPRTEEVR